ncbi:DUF5362 family protein [Sphingobacterium hungaricum]|uniref:DUF5362 domain-containing protein n=1 Tax=Sphingobacterium hungaricum TaxID=2082723 RepID=A0A928YPH3_9SPHI|nr:DUF5362 family protein [Sphingobacterium hungaricum]MBE8712497.1 hypothetical protein [Sphingobacterium hungaricum]
MDNENIDGLGQENPIPQPHSVADEIRNNHFHLNPLAISYLSNVAKWSGFISLTTLIMLGFILVALIFGIFASGFAAIFSEYGLSGASLVGLFIFYIIILGIAIIPTLWLYKFSQNTKKAIASRDSNQIAEAFNYLSKYYTFSGVALLIVLGFYAIIIVFMIFGGLAALMSS